MYNNTATYINVQQYSWPTLTYSSILTL